MQNYIVNYICATIIIFSVNKLSALESTGTSAASLTSQDASAEISAKSVGCKTNYNEQRPQVVYEDYKQCVFKYIQSVFNSKKMNKTDPEKKEFLVYLNQQMGNSKYYLERYTNMYIRSLVSDKSFLPDEAVLNALTLFSKNQDYKKPALIEFDAENEKKILLMMLAYLQDEKVEIVQKKKFTKPLRQVLGDTYREKLDSLIKSMRFSDVEQMNSGLQQILFEHRGLFQAKQRLLSAVRNYYSLIGNHIKVVEYSNELKKLSETLTEEALYDHTYSLMLLGKYEDCLNLINKSSKNIRSVEFDFSISKVKNYCSLELSKVSAASLLNESEKIKYGKSSDEFYNYKAELLIIDKKFDEAIKILDKSKQDYNLWRKVDLLVHQKKSEKALELAENIMKNKRAQDRISYRLKVFLLQYLNNKKQNYTRGLGKLVESCKSYLNYTSKENTTLIKSCKFAELTHNSSSKEEIKTFLAQPDPVARKLFQHQIIDSVSAGL